MDSTDDSILHSLDAENRMLLNHLPYLLKDITEIGTSADQVLEIIRKNDAATPDMSAIDLGCGKGAVAVKLARELGCKVRGIDALEEFVKEATEYAKVCGVTELCVFQKGDIRTITDSSLYDLVIYGAVGPIFGSIEKTIHKISGFVRPGGFLVIDESYCPEISKQRVYHSEKELYLAFRESGMDVIDESRTDAEVLRTVNKENNEKIRHRANELKRMFPLEAAVLDEYVRNQIRSCEILEHQLVSAVWLLQKRHTDRYI
ncbi:MAG: class I SAM-dependent methyltransferase [Chitinispirillaceae bacterium]